MLLSEDMVEEGLQVYKCTELIAIRWIPTISDDGWSDESVNPGELVAIDISRTCPFESLSNRPLLRSTDGSGWVFKQKLDTQLINRVSIQTGTWAVQVDNALRWQPIDSQRLKSSVEYQPREVVKCTHTVQASSGVKFY